MNRQITTLFRLSAVGIALLITMTAYWQIWAAPDLAAREDNARLVYRQLSVKRGLIYDAGAGQREQSADALVHVRRPRWARSETISSIASRAKLDTIDEPP